MAKSLNRPIRVDPKFKEVLEFAATERVRNGVEKRTPTMADLTRMFMNTEGFQDNIKQLKTRPRKEDLR